MEYWRQHVIAGLGVPDLDTMKCVDEAFVNLGPTPYPCPRCAAEQPTTVDAAEARLRDVSGPSVSQPARQAVTLQSVEARLRTVSGPSGNQPIQQDLTRQSVEARLRSGNQRVQQDSTLQSVEARLRTVSGLSNSQVAPQAPTWQEAQAEIYLREERAYALLDDEYERIMADLRLREEQARRIQEAEDQSRTLSAGTSTQANQPNESSFNQQTGEVGSLIQGAGRDIPDRRSRTQRYRDEARERRNRPSGLSQVVIAEEEEEEEEKGEEKEEVVDGRIGG